MDEENNIETGQVDNTEAVVETTETTEGNSGSFLDGLDARYRNDPNFTKFNSITDVLDSYGNLSKVLGKDKAVIPQEGDDYESQMAEYMAKVGRPETAEDYGIEDINLADDGIEAVIETGAYKEIAHKLNMTDAQAKGVLEYYVNDIKDNQARAQEQAVEAKKSAEAELRKEFGVAYEESLQNANKIFNDMFPSLKGSSELTRDPDFIRDLVKLSKNFNETSLGKPGVSGVRTPSEAKSEKEAIMNSEAYTNPFHAEHNAAVDKYFSLLEMELASNS